MTDTISMIKINDFNSNFNGTSLIGYVKTSYDKIVEKLGEPQTDFDKSTAHWTLEDKRTGTVATLYDWKNHSTPTDSYDWHIGGKDMKALQLIEEALGEVTAIPVHLKSWNPFGGGND